MASPVYALRLAGLGNQLFVAAACHSVATTLGRAPVLVRPIDVNPHSTRDYEDVLPLLHVSASELPPLTVITEDMVEKANVISTPILLRGYFQDAKYVSDTFCSLLRLPEPLPLPPCTLVLHLRGGDYLRPPQVFWHKIDILGYLDRARQRFPHLFARVLVFTNDKEYARSELDALAIPYVFAPDTDELQALSMMASSFIPLMISNSTFSWWAARLSDKARLKLMPRDWFPDASKTEQFKGLRDVDNMQVI